MINLAQSEPGIPVRVTELDTDPWLFNCLNGTIDLRTGELLPHRKENLITVLIPVEYHPEAQYPRWLNFLDKVTGGDSELAIYLQRAVGYSLTGDTRSQVIFLWLATLKG
jgi:putative DNA primase/helicase